MRKTFIASHRFDQREGLKTKKGIKRDRNQNEMKD